MVNMLAIETSVGVFRPGRGDVFLRTIKNLQHLFLGRGSKV
jgi:hypothetical protein